MSCRCIVRGSINIDDFFYVRAIVRPGETIASREYKRRIGGKGANQAIAISRAGGNVAFYGTVGRDGEWLITQVAAHNINVDGIIISDEPTGRALIQVADSGENSIVLFPGANHSQLHEDRIAEVDSYYCRGATHLLLQNEIHIQSTLYALEHSRGAITIVNPSPLPSHAQARSFPWHKVDWLIVNAGEAENLYNAMTDHEGVCISSNEEELLQLLSTLSSFKKSNIICTLGARGVLATLTPTGEGVTTSFIRVPAARLERSVLDTTGAGDCFTGYFVRELMKFCPGARPGNGMSEQDVENMLKVAVQAAAISVERPGTIDSIPSAHEVEERME